MHRLRDKGLKVPEDMAIIGCGNLLYADLLCVPLSSIDQHSGVLAKTLPRIALGILNSKVPPRL